MPVRNINQGVVAIVSLGGRRTYGTGFILSDQGYVATCAHVVAALLGPEPADGTTVKIRFAETGREATTRLILDWYRPEAAEDIAILAPDDPLPAAVTPLPLAGAANTIGHSIRSFGYPDYQGYDGLGALGTVVAHVKQDGIARLQLESTQITHGYSGGPIWDEALGAVIGQVVAGIASDKMGRHAFTAFATPADTLLDLLGPVLRRRQPFEPETVPVAAGSFLMGSRPGPDIPDHELPQTELYLPGFHVGRFPVTNAEYAAFLKGADYPQPAGWLGASPPRGQERHPIVNVSWFDAIAYCQWLAAQTGRAYRLPTEAEWEKAARGSDGRAYTWGDAWRDDGCNHHGQGTTAVDAFPAGASPYGCLDMLGNVREWTNTIWGSDYQNSEFPYPYRLDDNREDRNGAPQKYRIIRGSSYRDRPGRHRCAARAWYAPDSTNRRRGFRVVMA